MKREIVICLTNAPLHPGRVLAIFFLSVLKYYMSPHEGGRIQLADIGFNRHLPLMASIAQFYNNSTKVGAAQTYLSLPLFYTP